MPNGIITEYTVYIDLLNGTTKFKTIDTSNQEYIITDLSPYQLVEVGVSASTEVGEGSRSVPVEGRSQEAGTCVHVIIVTLCRSRKMLEILLQ